MNLEQWVKTLENIYKLHGATLSEEKKEILLTRIATPVSQDDMDKLKKAEFVEPYKTPLHTNLILDEAMIKGGMLSLEANIPEEYRSVTAELENILLKEFFRKVSNGETFGDETRIEQAQRTMFEQYRHSHGPFINMCRTFLTFTIEIKDLFWPVPAYYDIIVSQVLNSVLTGLRGVFFPSDGPKPPLKDRIKVQEELLRKYAPTFDRQGFLKYNPVLNKLSAEESKWPGVVYIVICLVLAWFVPQDRWWGKILFYILMGIIVLCLCGTFTICQKIVFGKTREEMTIERINREIEDISKWPNKKS